MDGESGLQVSSHVTHILFKGYSSLARLFRRSFNSVFFMKHELNSFFIQGNYYADLLFETVLIVRSNYHVVFIVFFQAALLIVHGASKLIINGTNS